MYIPRYENYTLDVPLEYKNLLKEEVLSYKSTIRQIILQKTFAGNSKKGNKM